jgi:hypothetical protein
VPWADAQDAEQIKNAFQNEAIDELYGRDGSPSFQGTEKKKKTDRPGPIRTTGMKEYEKLAGTAEYGKLNGEEKLIESHDGGRYPSNVIGEVEEGYQKYFYCPKVSRRERHVGFDCKIETNEELAASDGGSIVDANMANLPGIGLIYNHGLKTEVEKIRGYSSAGNNHPTVKPVALMEYLIKLVTPPSTPELQRKVLDPFMGSGSTGMAATALGHHFTGCELDPKYVAIAETRIEAWNRPEETTQKVEPELPPELFEEYDK